MLVEVHLTNHHKKFVPYLKIVHWRMLCAMTLIVYHIVGLLASNLFLPQHEDLIKYFYVQY